MSRCAHMCSYCSHFQACLWVATTTTTDEHQTACKISLQLSFQTHFFPLSTKLLWRSLRSWVTAAWNLTLSFCRLTKKPHMATMRPSLQVSGLQHPCPDFPAHLWNDMLKIPSCRSSPPKCIEHKGCDWSYIFPTIGMLCSLFPCSTLRKYTAQQQNGSSATKNLYKGKRIPSHIKRIFTVLEGSKLQFWFLYMKRHKPSSAVSCTQPLSSCTEACTQLRGGW